MSGPSRSFRCFALLFATLLMLAAVPVLRGEILPLVDYPNHLARMYVLANLPSSPILQTFYAIQWRPVPNLAMDALVPALSHLIPLVWAGKVFVLFTFLLLAGGTAALHRTIVGRWSAWPCLAFLLLYNRIFLWGFLNYLFGIGLALLAFAAWIALRERSAAMRLAVSGLLALATYFAHLMAYGVYGLLVLGYEAGLLWHRRARLGETIATLALSGIPLLPPLAILLIGSPGAVAGAVTFARPWRKLDLLFSVFDDYNRPFDIACFVLACGGFALAFWRRWIRLEPGMAWPLLLLGLVFLALPSQLFTASGADHRLPLVLALVLVAATSWVGSRASSQRYFLAAAAALFLLRLGVVTVNWHDAGLSYETKLAAFDEVPTGSAIAVAFPGRAVHAQGVPLVHLPTWEIARRQAFVPTLAVFATQQPVALRPPYDELADRASPGRLWSAFAVGAPPLDGAQLAAFERYDFVVFIDARPIALADTSGLQPVYLSPTFQLYRLTHPPRTLDDTLDPQ